jgi:hypothetical protein
MGADPGIARRAGEPHEDGRFVAVRLDPDDRKLGERVQEARGGELLHAVQSLLPMRYRAWLVM